MHNYIPVIQNLLLFRYFLDLQFNHTHKHKHNSNKHKTPIFTWFTTNEVATSTGTLSLLYAVKGIQSSYYALFAVSLSSFFSKPLCTKQPEHYLLSLLGPIHLPIRYAGQKAKHRCINVSSLYYLSFLYKVTQVTLVTFMWA